jgi:hypothetical protein
MRIALPVLICISIFVVSGRANLKSDVAVITEYVVEHKHWRTADFQVEQKECDCAYPLYWILYLPEAKKPPTGGGKSFAVYYDPIKHRVVKEMYFQ